MAAILTRQLKTTRNRQKELPQLSPFELKDNLIHLAKEKPAPERGLNLKGGKTGCAAVQAGETVVLSRFFA
jgi:aspartate 4-decarboxylase